MEFAISLALFVHLDEKFEVSKAPCKLGEERLISKDEYLELKERFGDGELSIGGNAGNAAVFLNQLGVKHLLSAPIRPKKVVELLGNFTYFALQKGFGKEARNDPCFVHLVFESSEGRCILTYDPMVFEGWLDELFWEKVEGLLFISGFHLIRKRSRIREILELLEEKRERLVIHLEFGEPNRSMAYAWKKMLELNLVDSASFNEREARLVGDVQSLHESEGLELSLHTPDFAFSTKEEGLRELIDVVSAFAMGDVRLYRKVKELALKGYGKFSARILPYMERKTGLGDAFGALDAIRIHKPELFWKIISRLQK